MAFARRRAATIISYSTSLKANRNAAVSTLWLTFGPMPAFNVSVSKCYHESPTAKKHRHTFIKAGDPLLPDNLIQTLPHALNRLVLGRHMRPTFDCNIGICDA